MLENWEEFSNGKNAAAIRRAKLTGKGRETKEDRERKEREARKQEELEEKYKKWNRGLRQIEEVCYIWHFFAVCKFFKQSRYQIISFCIKKGYKLAIYKCENYINE